MCSGCWLCKHMGKSRVHLAKREESLSIHKVIIFSSYYEVRDIDAETYAQDAGGFHASPAITTSW